MLVSIRIATNMAAGNQQKHPDVTEFCYKNIKITLFLIQELFG